MNTFKVISDLVNYQKNYTELYKSNKGLVTIDEKHVHISDYLFGELFTEEEVTMTKHTGTKYPYWYSAERFGVEFMCMSKEPLEFRTANPIELVANDLIRQWREVEHPITYAVYYGEGTFTLKRFKDVETDDMPIYNYTQFINPESIDLENAMLDYLEVLHNEPNV